MDSWTGMTTEKLEMCGWPTGMDEETAEWLCRMCSRVLSESKRPLSTYEVYEQVKHLQERAYTPKGWKNAVLYDWSFKAIDRALRSLGASMAWVGKDDPHDPWFIVKRSEVVKDNRFICGSVSRGRKKSATYCPSCIPQNLKSKLGESWIDTWEIGDRGFIAAPVCQVCKVAIAVHIDGEPSPKGK